MTDPTRPIPEDPTRPLPADHPQQGHPQQGYPPVGGPAPEAPKRARTGPAVIAAVAVAGVAVLGGGGAFAWSRLSAKGAQPDTVIPASAMAFARVDLDPAAGQKVAAVRFLGKLPGMSATNGADPRAGLWKALTEQDPDLATTDFATEVAPWLGDRAAFALLPGSGTTPLPVVAVAVTDEAKGAQGISALLAKKHETSTEVVTRSGYALLTTKGSGASVLAELDKGALATNPTYTADLAALGDTGVASMWVDGAALAKAVTPGGATSTFAGALSGRLAAAVRFDPSYVELAGITRAGGTGAGPVPAVTGTLSSLPADTLAAVTVNGAGEGLKRQWSSLEQSLGSTDFRLSDLQDETGLRLPDDLVTLLGSSFTVVLPHQDFQAREIPLIGTITRGTDAQAAAKILDNLTYKAGLGDSVTTTASGDTLYAATEPDYVATLGQTGTLGSTPAFTQAVRDPDKAVVAGFVDLDAIESSYLSDVPKDQRDAVQALRAVGFSAMTDGPGGSSFSLRVVGN